MLAEIAQRAESAHPDRSRAISRMAAQYFLRMLDVIKSTHSGGPLKGIIFTAIWSANVGHLRSDASYDAADAPPPDEMRRPVTISAIAQSLDLPNETVRRYVVKLISEGLCVKHGRQGVIVPASVFAREAMLQGLEIEQSYTRQYHRALSKLL